MPASETGLRLREGQAAFDSIRRALFSIHACLTCPNDDGSGEHPSSADEFFQQLKPGWIVDAIHSLMDALEDPESGMSVRELVTHPREWIGLRPEVWGNAKDIAARDFLRTLTNRGDDRASE